MNKEGRNYGVAMNRLLKHLRGISSAKRKELVLNAYSSPELKAGFDSYDKIQDKEESGKISINETCNVCKETYTARGRQNSIGICDRCLETHVAIRDRDSVQQDKDLASQEKELEISLRAYGCLRRRRA